MLGRTTKVYRSYGKSKHHTINKQSVLWIDDSDSESELEHNAAAEEATDSDVQVYEPPSPPQKKAAKQSKRDALAVLKEKRASKQKNQTYSEADQDKENNTVAKHGFTRPPNATKPTKPVVEIITLASASKAPRRQPLKPRKVSNPTQTPTKSAPAFEVITLSTEEEPPSPVIVPLKRTTRQSRRIQDSSEEDFVPIPAVSPPRTRRTRASSLRNHLPTRTDAEPSNALSSLLGASLNPSPAPIDFTSFVESPPAPFASSPFWRKVGEASYSEVFATTVASGEEIVVKIIPVSVDDGKETGENWPERSSIETVMRELQISRLTGGEGPLEGFVKYNGAFITHGSYPQTLLSCWDTFKKAQRPPCDDQTRPHILPNDQVYAVICLANGGLDLEHYKLKSWKEAASVLYQTMKACSAAEEAVQFEHRDLHWGNLLIRPVPQTRTHDLADRFSHLQLTPSKSKSVNPSQFDAQTSGVEVTLIDFTLSRATKEDGENLWDDFEDECIFEGEGDEQFDVYRQMREIVKGEWQGFHPETNLMWLHYLSRKLLYSKKLRVPLATPPTPSIASPLRTASRPNPSRRRRPALATQKSSTYSKSERTAYELLVMLENILGENVRKVLNESRTRSRSKTSKNKKGKIEVQASGWRSARDAWAFLTTSR